MINSFVYLEFVLFTSLKLYEDWILLWWNKISVDDRLRLRITILNTVSSSHPLQHNRSIRFKLAHILCEIAKREFPICWPSLLTDMIQLWSNQQAIADV